MKWITQRVVHLFFNHDSLIDMKNFKNIFAAVFILSALTLAGCASRQIDHKVENEVVTKDDKVIRQFTGRAEVLNRQDGRIHTVDMDFIAQGRTGLRLDVIGTFATPVAAVVLQDSQLTCLLPRQKRFYQGPANPDALASVIGVRLEPELFFNLLFDETPLSKNGWSCKTGADKKVESCENLRTGQKLEWSDRQQGRRKLVISDKRFQVTMKVGQVPTKVLDGAQVFSLAIPKGYTSLK